MSRPYTEADRARAERAEARLARVLAMLNWAASDDDQSVQGAHLRFFVHAALAEATREEG